MKLRRTTPRRATPRRATPRRTSRVPRLKRTRSRAARRLRGGSRHRRDNGYSYKTIAALGTAGVAGALALRALTKKQKEPTAPKLETKTHKKLREIKNKITEQFTLRDLTLLPDFNTALTDVYCIVACNDEEERGQTRLKYYIALIITLQLSRQPRFNNLKDDGLNEQTQSVKSTTSCNQLFKVIVTATNVLRNVNSDNTKNVILNTVDAISDAMVRQDEPEQVDENDGDVLVDTQLDAIITKYTVFQTSWSGSVIIERDPYKSFLQDRKDIARIGTILKNGTPAQVQKYHEVKELVRVYRLFFEWDFPANDTRDEYDQLRETFNTLENSNEDACEQRRKLLEHLLDAKSKDFARYSSSRNTELDLLQVCAALKKVSELSTQIRKETCSRAAE
jgi:hypothetical protein